MSSTTLVRIWRLRAALFAIATLWLAAPSAANAQLYQPRSIKKAFDQHTRSPDGKPGARYWQNHARYDIDVSLAPPTRAVRGTERIAYFNDSPDTLRTIVVKLFVNIHKPGAPRGGGASADYLTDGVHIDTFSVNGATTPWPGNDGTFTLQGVRLASPILPHDSAHFAFAWHYDASKESGREGMIDSTTAFLAYFYPRVAVYDDTNGWDTMNFTDTQEFYSDFNDYEVTVHAPAGFVVWGTGTLVNAGEVLQPAPLARFQASLTSDTTIHVATRQDMMSKLVTTNAAMNAWHFRARNVPDMAFNVSDHYVWDAGSVVVDDATHRRAGVQAAFNDTAADYHHMVQFGRHALTWLSHNWPGVPYPYEKTTIVQGFAGMEYPMMANDESYADTSFARFVAEHEIAHTYMPFYMGIDESRYGFMDEGWATTFEYLINIPDFGPEKAQQFFRDFRVGAWVADPSPLEDLPIITPADALKGVAYGINAYGKPALGYLALKDMLGDEMFGRVLHGYMDRWHGKHPIPWDFFNTVNDLSGKNLDWFWKSWYFDNGYVDIGITSVAKRVVTLDNVGGMPAPVDLLVTYTDGSTAKLHETSAIWTTNLRRAKVMVPGRKAVRSVVLEHGIWVDAASANDRWSAAP